MEKELAFETSNKKLNVRQKRFCELYTSQDNELFGNGVWSYVEAYDVDQSKPNWYMKAASSATRLLKNVHIIVAINELLEQNGFSDQFADKQLSFLMAQHADFQSKLGAVKEYNKLKGRIVEKSLNLNVTLPKPIYGGKSIRRHDSDQANLPAIKEN